MVFVHKATMSTSIDPTAAQQPANRTLKQDRINEPGYTDVKGVPAYADEEASDETSIQVVHDKTHRSLKPRHIQLIGIGGTIGTALYVSIGQGLLAGGPASLFLAFTIW